ncbi:uncharacterized protein N7469_005204 [Penicillium citrinum]|uniref:DUF7732 domain-containing protein n=1 Tax=Penicillium citrinum TaxID=5077 RepID=A0A9W9TPF3_PENCI|nr:uncharacterized protein N7469_005204 [Penicillium citrinum]KAJ5233438.1 hypothetical protein N7469_005204 [Penicillium citrinum]
MKLSWATSLLLLCSTGVSALSIPRADLILHDQISQNDHIDLEKRRGGGGGGGRGGSSGSSGGSSGGRSGSSSSGSSSGSSGSSGSRGSTSSSSNRGGSSSGGSGVAPSYGGGRYGPNQPPNQQSSSGSSGYYPGYTSSSSGSRSGLSPTHAGYYSGGALSPYTAGRASPSARITPFLLPVAALAFFPGIWLYGAYAYPYSHPYHYHNNTSNHNDTLPVVCLCEEHQECGCDDNNNSTYYEDLFNGTQPKNTSNTRVVNVNGTEKIYINGTLPNGTTADDGTESSASPAVMTLMHASGYWATFAVVAAAVSMI